MGSIRVDHTTGDQFAVRIRGHSLIVDQPMEAGGEDAGPTPTEVFVASLAACAAFYAERFLRRHDLPVEGLAIECDFIMSEDRPARVSRIDINLALPDSFPEDRVEALRRVVEHCTVHNSIREAPEIHLSLGQAALAGLGTSGL